MKSLPVTPELLAAARRVMWFAEPERALAEPVQFLTHVMVFGGVEDAKALCEIVGKAEYREVLEHAPPGIFGARSLAYWTLVRDRQPTSPLPVRALPPLLPARASSSVASGSIERMSRWETAD